MVIIFFRQLVIIRLVQTTAKETTMQTTTTPSRVALVTGGSRGIGAAVAARLARDGYAVAINYVQDADQARQLAATLTEAGHRAIHVRANVADAGDVRYLFDVTEQLLGPVDVLVNSAGILKIMPLAETSDTVFDQTIAVNLKGTFNTMREAAARLRDGGRIINFSTSLLATNLPGYAAYNASKAAVEAMTRVFVKELRGRAITVNAVAPGPVATDLFLQGKTPEQIAHFSKLPPLERLGEPEDIARVVSFLAGPEGGWINGQTLRANGGLA
jgi:3-oxoacyl-[acyl-carrier protein] reductase